MSLELLLFKVKPDYGRPFKNDDAFDAWARTAFDEADKYMERFERIYDSSIVNIWSKGFHCSERDEAGEFLFEAEGDDAEKNKLDAFEDHCQTWYRTNKSTFLNE